MFGAFTSFGKLGSLARAIAAAWSPLSLWPNGILSPGMWISPRDLTSEWQDYTGTTPVAVPGTVADSANPVGLALDIRAGATVLTDPGNHMLQSTSTARPLLSARVNLLLSSTSFDWWRKAALLTYGQEDPFGGSTGTLIATLAANSFHGIDSLFSFPASLSGLTRFRFYVKPAGITYINVAIGPCQLWDTFVFTCFNLSGGGSVVRAGYWAASSSITPAANGFYLIELETTQAVQGPVLGLALDQNTTEFLGDGISGVIVSHSDLRYVPDKNIGTPYQRVTTDSDYDGDPAKFPYYLKFDGTDDGIATASFTAGTLINGMDCMIAVRRDSGTHVICGIYDGVLVNRYTGYAESGVSAPCHKNSGSPTTWVDGVQLAGGTATSADALNSALTVGDWHILEYRNLDLSAYESIAFGTNYFGYCVNGGRGDIFLFPSTASTEDKDAARQYLADYYGVTLP